MTKYGKNDLQIPVGSGMHMYLSSVLVTGTTSTAPMDMSSRSHFG